MMTRRGPRVSAALPYCANLKSKVSYQILQMKQHNAVPSLSFTITLRFFSIVEEINNSKILGGIISIFNVISNNLQSLLDIY